MKKLFIALMACAATVSCSKSDVVYDNGQSEIAFSPVAQNTTKSVAGYNKDDFDGVFPTDIDLYVFANAVEGTYSANNSGAAYFQNALFKWDEDKGSEATQPNGATPNYSTTGAYAGNPTRYWPNVKKLIFAGYSDACGVDKTAATMNFATNTLTIPSYTQNNETYVNEGTNDLMWFSCDGTAYDKSANEIAAAMKHACSWITVKVLSDGNYTDLKLKGLTINDLYHTGTATCNGTAAEWTTSGETESEVLYSNEGEAVTTVAKIFENTQSNMVVIPQVPTTIDVTYSFVPQVGVDAISETKTGLSLKYNGDAAWESGKHYIYTITITATEILIDPYVVDWTSYTGNEIQK